MPMEKTFWGAYFGMFTDKFGINWMINFDEMPQY
jgi:PhnB protein